MTKDATSFITMLAVQAASDPAFLGWVLARFSEAEGVSGGALAERLGADLVTLPDLALCLRPRTETFASDVRAIRERFAVDDASLVMIVRHVEVLETMRAGGTTAVGRGSLLAARMRPRGGAELHPGQGDPPVEDGP